MKCENTNHKEGEDYKNEIVKIKLTRDFGSEFCDWCYDCRKRDRDMIEKLA